MKNYNKIIEKLKDLAAEYAGEEAPIYLVGGCVRDEILGLEPKDIDLCIDQPEGTEKFTTWLKENKPETSGFVIFPRFGTAKFTLNLDDGEKADIECVIPRSERYIKGSRKPVEIGYTSLVEDSFRRDFCCNALYKNIVTGQILDPTGKGLEDIQNKILRTPLDPETTFRDDPLRMLRAMRFKYLKGFEFAPGLAAGLSDYPDYYLLSKERINEEISKLLVTPHASEYIRELHKYGLLKNIFPELEKSWGFDQKSKYHSLSLTDHILAVLDKVSGHGDLRLSLAAILHDISKYLVHEINSIGGYSYHNHETLSAEMAYGILKRLKYDNDTINDVCKLIKNHMILKPFWSDAEKAFKGSIRSIRRIGRVFDEIPGIGLLIDADNMSHAPEYCMPDQVKQFEQAYQKIKVILPEKKKPSFISGEEIMKKFGLRPGKTIGEIKDVLERWKVERPEETKESLLEAYEDFYPNILIDVVKNPDGTYLVGEEKIKLGKDFNLPDKINPLEYPKVWDYCMTSLKIRDLVKDKLIPSLQELRQTVNIRGEINILIDDEGLNVKTSWDQE